jgi:hypothetical protein
MASNNIDVLKGPLIFVTPKSLNLVQLKKIKNKKCFSYLHIEIFNDRMVI